MMSNMIYCPQHIYYYCYKTQSNISLNYWSVINAEIYLTMRLFLK